jgi:hypothetical protein
VKPISSVILVHPEIRQEGNLPQRIEHVQKMGFADPDGINLSLQGKDYISIELRV